MVGLPLLLLVGACALLPGTGAISFYLPADGKKCLKEEIHKDVLVTGEYEVTDSVGHILFSKEKAKKGKFAFTTDDYDVYEVCFENSASSDSSRSPEQLIVLDVKHGVEAKNYEDLAKAEKLKPLEVELRRLEDLSDSIVKDFSYMKKREEEMRDTNGYVHICVVRRSVGDATHNANKNAQKRCVLRRMRPFLTKFGRKKNATCCVFCARRLRQKKMHASHNAAQRMSMRPPC
ncbi:unnamed protein product [Ranitomeya imitator]|uniref:GOLD domain-containing protein n=1 Tax=Ranitomeya imitator TaxID=111125 RepID=A0ABN9LRC0_9NEOB|nr:unnamed protein product [Ranitomeya imitator]